MQFWKKEVLFGTNLYKKLVRYHKQDGSENIKSLHIVEYDITSILKFIQADCFFDITIYLYENSTSKGPRLEELCQSLCAKSKCQFYSAISKLSVTIELKKNILPFLNLLETFDQHINTELKKDVLVELELKKSEQQLTEEVISLVAANKVKEAVEMAISLQEDEHCYQLIWTLIGELHNKIFVNRDDTVHVKNLAKLYANVSTQNPHFEQACIDFFHLICTQNPQTEEEKNFNLEMRLKLAIQGKDYALATPIFHQLCGNVDLNPSIKDIGTPDAIIRIAREHKIMKKELEELRKYKRANENSQKFRDNIKLELWKQSEVTNKEKGGCSPNCVTLKSQLNF